MWDPDDCRVKGKRLGLCFGSLLKSFATDETSRNPTAVEVLNVMQTARRTRASIGEPFDNNVAAFYDILQHAFWRRLGVRRLLETQHSVALPRQ